MDFLTLAQQRYSCRKYSGKPVEPEKLDLIVKAVMAAPTGCNFQPQRILVADNAETLDKIRACTPFQFGAPVTYVICYDKTACWSNAKGEGVGEIDASIVLTHIILQAAELGLGTCIVASFNKDELIKKLDIPANFVPIALLPMGYPAEDDKPAGFHYKSLPAENVFFNNKF